jgi:hypothetical protein
MAVGAVNSGTAGRALKTPSRAMQPNTQRQSEGSVRVAVNERLCGAVLCHLGRVVVENPMSDMKCFSRQGTFPLNE